MGKYINQVNDVSIGTSYTEKCTGLIEAGAKEVNGSNFEKDLVCVVDSGLFGVAGYAYDEGEYEVFKREDGRPKRWFILNNAESHVDK